MSKPTVWEFVTTAAGGTEPASLRLAANRHDGAGAAGAG